MHSSINAERLVNLFVNNIFSKYRVSSYVMSDRKTKFVLKFFKSLAIVLNMKLHFLADYYLEADGQIKETN